MRYRQLLLGGTVAVAAMAAGSMLAVEVDLTTAGSTPQSLVGSFGGTAFFQNVGPQPTGTGVFDPFLTINSHGNSVTERGYNSPGFTDGLFLDQVRPQWNNTLKLSDLAIVTLNNLNYYAFTLDADEPQNAPNNLISIDNIRVYTSAADNVASVQNNEANLDSLGTLRWAMDNPLKDSSDNYLITNWVNLDADNHGQGQADMEAFIPVSAFAGASSTDFVWFYNLNGVHEAAQTVPPVPGTGATGGFEEWAALVGPNTPEAPDGGTTVMLLGSALAGLGYAARRCKASLRP